MNTATRPRRAFSLRPGGRRRLALFVLTALLAIATVVPLVWMVSGSFKGASAVYNLNVIPVHATLDNFSYVFTQIPFLRYMINSFFVAVTVTVAALWFHSMAAYALARLDFPGRELIFAGIFSTLLVALPVILVPLFLVVKTLGMLDSYWGLIIPAIPNAFGIFLLRQFYITMPRELEEAAVIDGYGYWGIYWHIIVPLSRPILGALSVFFFLANWNSFLWPLTITSNQSLWMVQVGIASFQGEYGSAWNYILAASTVAALPTLVLFFIFQRRLVESIKTTGLK